MACHFALEKDHEGANYKTTTVAVSMVFKASVKRRLGVKAASLRFGKTAALGA
jgi:hypothetical protein